MDQVDRLLAEKDELGIVTELRAMREKYRPRLLQAMFKKEINATIRKTADERIQAEVDRIVARRMAAIHAEQEKLNQPTGPSVRDILDVVAAVTGQTVAELVGPRRMRSVAQPRQLAYHLVKVLRSDLSLPAIGRVLGGRDHTSVMHGLRKFADMRERAPFAGWMADPRIVALLGEPTP